MVDDHQPFQRVASNLATLCDRGRVGSTTTTELGLQQLTVTYTCIYYNFRINIYKLDLSISEHADRITPPPANEKSRPNFRVPETQVGTNYNTESDVYKTVDSYLNKYVYHSAP